MSLKVLVVEEEGTVRELFKAMLVQEGYTVAMAASGREGTKKAVTGKYDLAIVDVRMADLSGEEVARMIRFHGLTLPIIAATGGDMIVCPAWANALLRKPFGVKDLRAAVAKATA